MSSTKNQTAPTFGGPPALTPALTPSPSTAALAKTTEQPQTQQTQQTQQQEEYLVPPADMPIIPQNHPAADAAAKGYPPHEQNPAKGGLYSGNVNTPPPEYATKYLETVNTRIKPRDIYGKPAYSTSVDEPGKIITLFIGGASLSKIADQIIKTIQNKKETQNDPATQGSIFLNACHHSMGSLSQIADPKSQYWIHVAQVVERQGLSLNQVQVIFAQAAFHPLDKRDERFTHYINAEKAEMVKMVETVCQIAKRIAMIVPVTKEWSKDKKLRLRNYWNAFSVRLLQDGQTSRETRLNLATRENIPVIYSIEEGSLWSNGNNPSVATGYAWCDDDIMENGDISDKAAQMVSDKIMNRMMKDEMFRKIIKGK